MVDGPLCSIYLSLNCFTVVSQLIVSWWQIWCQCTELSGSLALCAPSQTKQPFTQVRSSELYQYTVGYVYMYPYHFQSSAWLAGSDRKVTAVGMGYSWKWNDAKCSQCWNKHPDLDAPISCCGWLTLFEVLDSSGYIFWQLWGFAQAPGTLSFVLQIASITGYCLIT